MSSLQCINTYRPNATSKASAPVRRSATEGLVRDHRAISEQVLEWSRRIGFRRSLRVLPDKMLAALGMNRDQAAEEAAKPFWLP
jgi:uncharacterized protein YjiS (DUF1127 family)